MRFWFFIALFGFCFLGFSQRKSPLSTQKKFAIQDTIRIDSVSINPFKFQVLDRNLKPIDSSQYYIDYGKSILSFKQVQETDSIYINYTKYPEFFTRKYYTFDESLIVENNSGVQKLYQLGTSNTNKSFMPFSGLETSGSISRGFTIGNNQNSVLNSELDLQVSGKISEKVSLRASLQDANIPIQESGYSQRLDEFDQIFVELYSDNWLLRAGDVNLENSNSYFGRFTKKVQGIYATGTMNGENAKTTAFLSGALVRGQYAKSTIQGQEGNQGPYKLSGPNGELFVLLVSGSETVYVNGLQLERGENNDYVIDYNAGEIRFNASYPITSEMRITVEYQYSDRNYSRIIAYGGGSHERKKLTINAHVYTEHDSKNQPLQQNLSTEQVDILQDAGDDSSLMTAPSAIPEAYSENKILYRKELNGGIETFVFSTNPDDELFQVRFRLVGNGLGNYIIDENFASALGRVYRYVAPVAGVPQGNYEPVIQLVAPTKLQMAVVSTQYTPTEKTNVYFELAGSKNDLNLFSSLDDENNNGFASKLRIEQKIVKNDSAWSLNAFIDTDHIDKNFKTIERLYQIEFDRDWNLETPLGHQNIFKSGVQLQHPKKGTAQYSFEHLNYSENYKGSRHLFSNDFLLNRFRISSNSSFLQSKSTILHSSFLQASARAVYDLKNAWIGAKTSLEDNQQENTSTQLLTGESQKFSAYEVFSGIGDSTNIFVELGYKHRINDSLRNGTLERVNSSNTYYLKSKILNTTQSQLSVLANYRTLHFTSDDFEDEKNLNSRILYQQLFAKNSIRFTNSFEMNAGNVAQQEFTFIEVDEGQGYYTWIDYNNNGVQELNEFEVAQFQDQANYIKILLPNQVFIKTKQNKWSSSLTLDPKNWSKKDSSFLAHWYNQTSFIIDKKTKRNGTIGFNLFSHTPDDLITHNSSFKNILFFNRGKQHYSTTYTYLQNKNKSLLSIGAQENQSKSHQLQFTHLFYKQWLLDFTNKFSNTQNTSFTSDGSINTSFNNNYELDELSVFPKFSFLASANTKFDAFYEFTQKKNRIGALEQLKQQRLGLSFSIAHKEKLTFNGEFNYYLNDFEGNSFSPTAYQMLEGLEQGKNLTWNAFIQKRVTQFLDLNIAYFGRKTESSSVIHNGSIQLKAFF